MNESINHQRGQKKSHIDDPDLLKLMIKLFSKKLISKKLSSTTSSSATSPNVSNPTSPASTSSKTHCDIEQPPPTTRKMSQERQSPATKTTSPSSQSPHHRHHHHHHHHHHHKEHHHAAKKLKHLEQDLIRVEYYNDFNSCLSLSQTLTALNASGGSIETSLKLKTVTPTSGGVVSVESSGGGNTLVGASIPREQIKQQTTTSTTTATKMVAENQQKSKSPIKFPQQQHQQQSNPQQKIIQQQQQPVNNEKRPSDFFGLSSTQRQKMTVNTCPDGDTDINLNAGSRKLLKITRDPSQSFGISIVGGKVNVADDVWISGIFIKDVIPNSPADLSKQIKVGDRILSIDDIDLRNSSHQQAINIIRKAGQSITILVESLKEKDNQSGTNNTTNETSPLMPSKLDKTVPPPVTPSKSPVPEVIQDNQNKIIKQISSENETKVEEIKFKATEKMDDIKESKPNESDYSSDEDDDDNSTELSGRTVSKAGKEIDRASAGNVKRSRDEISLDKEKEDEFGYTADKITKKYSSFGHVYKCTIERTADTYVGISLSGHKDRNKMATLVAGINPKGIAVNSPIKVGDEILEVNGVVLHGRCHLNASVIIKELSGNKLSFVMLRRQSAAEDLAVKPLRQFPLHLFNDNDDMFSNFKNVKVIKIKKGASGLGIMIIEGRHSEAGQGIFISDIQEGSSAEHAGLAIGDMILAVNSEVLLGCSYENAASLLKKSEGLISLRVCSPSKEKDKENTRSAGNSLYAPTPDQPKTPAKAITAKTPSKTPDRSLTASPLPKAEKSPSKEPVNLLTAQVVPNKECDIEVNTGGKSLGIRVVGGANTHVNTGIVIVQIYPGSVAEKDNRLKLFDQILDVNGIKLAPTLSNEQIEKNIKQLQPRVKLTIYRADPSELATLTIDYVKKSGKSIGIEMFEMLPYGVMITDLIGGCTAASDNRLQVGDIITHINNEDVRKLKPDECTAVMRSCQGSVTFKIVRPAPKKR